VLSDPPGDAEIQEIFRYGCIHLTRVTGFEYEPLLDILTAAARPGRVVVVAVAGLVDVAEGFGMQGIRDTAKFLAEYVAYFAPPGAYVSALAWTVMGLFVPDPAPDPVIDADRMHRLVQTTDLELAADRSIRLDLVVGEAAYDGVQAKRAIYDAVREANVALRALEGPESQVMIMDLDWRPSFTDEYPG
jgi:hypothetical protein